MPESKARTAAIATVNAVKGGQREDENLSTRETPELVIALVGAIGSGVTTTANVLMTELKDRYGYIPRYVHVSDIIAERARAMGETVPSGDKAKRILQKVGTALREQYGQAYLAEKCVEQIAVYRAEKGYRQEGDRNVAVPLRQVHVIDSLKNPAEVNLFRQVYGANFWLVGVFAPESVRRVRLRGLNNEMQQVMETDEEEGVDYGQRVRETIHVSDFFVRNDGENDVRLKSSVARYLSILFNIGVQTPTQNEQAMANAVSAAEGSACLSRQVGASIYTASGELIGVGSNDVPKKGGGLYSCTDGDEDHRCFKWGGKICHNDEHKVRLYKAIDKALRTSGIIPESTKFSEVEAALRLTEVKNLIEYSRAVHAEMEAIISVARCNKNGLIGSTMYVTTFPCHHCARHIVASGIQRVIYIEPYPKSLALDLHSDAISPVEDGSGRHVEFLQYEGVAPKNMVPLFKHGRKRKENGKLFENNPREASPVYPSPLDGFSTREQIIVAKLKKQEENRGKGGESGNEEKKEAGATQLTLAGPEKK
jgi:deoxycytidylate deaminase